MLSGSGGKIKNLNEVMGVQISKSYPQRTRRRVRPRRDSSDVTWALCLTGSSPQLEGSPMESFSRIRILGRPGVDLPFVESGKVVLMSIKCKKS